MALNASGTLSANSGVAGTNIALEFGWTPPFSLATKTPRGTVPTSAFNLSAFRGTSNGSTVAPVFAPASPVFFNVGGVGFNSSCTTRIIFNSDGTITRQGNVITSGHSSYLTVPGAGFGADYEIRAVGVIYTGGAMGYANVFGEYISGTYTSPWRSLASAQTLELLADYAYGDIYLDLKGGSIEIRNKLTLATISTTFATGMYSSTMTV